MQARASWRWGLFDFVGSPGNLANGSWLAGTAGGKVQGMERAELLQFLRRYRVAVEATVAATGQPQAAVVGFAVSDDLEIVFDTTRSTRKLENLERDPRIALVIGWDDDITAQVEGVADLPTGSELERIRECYFEVYPDGRERLQWEGICHVRVRPTWVRYSDFTQDPPRIEELKLG